MDALSWLIASKFPIGAYMYIIENVTMRTIVEFRIGVLAIR